MDCELYLNDALIDEMSVEWLQALGAMVQELGFMDGAVKLFASC